MTRLVLAGADAKAGAEFTSFTAGGLHTCGVRADGSVACWGSHGSGRATTPSGEFTSVSAGGSHTCEAD